MAKLSKEVITKICFRHVAIPFYGTSPTSKNLAKRDWGLTVEDWQRFCEQHDIDAKELIRIIKEGRDAC